MNYNLEFKKFDPRKRIGNLIDKLIKRVEKKAGDTHPEALRKEHFSKRQARSEKVRKEIKSGVAGKGAQRRELFFSLVSENLGRLYRFVRHEIDYFQSLEHLASGELTPEDVVDAVILRAYDEFVTESSGREVRSWLLGLAIDQVEAEVERIRAERERFVHVEEDIPETPPEKEVSTLGDEVLDFYQPDEALKLEDILPGLDLPSPEQEAETRELRQCLATAVVKIPKLWRRILMLRYSEGFSPSEIAQTTYLSESEVERILEYARENLRERLIESKVILRPVGRFKRFCGSVGGSARHV